MASCLLNPWPGPFLFTIWIAPSMFPSPPTIGTVIMFLIRPPSSPRTTCCTLPVVMVFFTRSCDEAVFFITETKSVFLISRSLGTSPSATTLVQMTSSFSASTTQRMDMSHPSVRSTVFIAERSTRSKILSSSAAVLCLSTASASRRSSTLMPRRQPTVTPTQPPAVWAILAEVRSFCREVRPALGRFGRSLPTRASTVPPDMIPLMSDTIWPSPAAAMVVSPRVSPMLDCILSPAVIITTLSMMPNPTIGMAHRTACAQSWCLLGSGTADVDSLVDCRELTLSGLSLGARPVPAPAPALDLSVLTRL
mmetsp:Transcript_4007/g.14054  ORF Transcript_4007/g.14054 Transcript_4007/m.14054 type:complete len:308 (+) Transcript_4007:965-1888(+)